MNIMSASLGVNCQYCHAGTDFAVEHAGQKDVAREMIDMTLTLNRTRFQGQPQITCYTCHRGQTRPDGTVPLEMRIVSTSELLRPDSITVEQAIANWEQGSYEGTHRPTHRSRHSVGKRIEPDGRSEPEEIWLSADGKSRMVTNYGTLAVVEGYDGKKAWKKAGDKAIELKPDEAEQILLEARFGFAIDIADEYTKLEFGRLERMGDREVWVLIGTSSSGTRDELRLDRMTGRLVQRKSSLPTLLGPFVYQVDYMDFQSFDGWVLATRIRYAVPNISWTREVQSVNHDVPTDPLMFQK